MTPLSEDIDTLACLPMKSESEMGMVEIIVLKYKAPEVEVECVRSIVENTEWPYKLVVYDNRKNTANTSKIWNKLIRDSTCDYVLFIDSDAFVPDLRPCWLTRMMSTFKEIPECQVVITVSNEPGGEFQQRAPEEKPPEAYSGIFAGFCFLFRKSVIDAIGWFDEDFYFYAGDSEWAARFQNNPGQVFLRPDVYVEHLQHYSLAKAEREAATFDVVTERERAIQLYFAKTGTQGDLPRDSRWGEIERLVRLPMMTESQMEMVEIIVLKFNAPEVEVKCAQRIIENTDWPYKLVIYDNRKNTANTAKIWNKLIRDSTCDYILFIDSDAFAPKLDPCWLTRMMLTFREFPACQAVIPVSNHVGGDYQARKAEEKPPEEYCATFSGFCFLFRKSAVSEVGWFDEEFYLYGADSEWSTRFMRTPGQVILRPDIWVEHLGSYSRLKANDEQGIDWSADIQRSSALCMAKTAWVSAAGIQRYSRPIELKPPETQAPPFPSAVRLNLGCGRDYRLGWVNCDVSPAVKADVYFDIRGGLPFPEACVDEIYISGVLAQMTSNEDFRNVMNECWRVLRNGGTMLAVAPSSRYPAAFQDPFDSRHFVEETWEYLTEGTRYYELFGSVYGFQPWQQISLETNSIGIMTVILRKPLSAVATEPRTTRGAVRVPATLKVAVIGATYPLFERVCPHWCGIQSGLQRLEIPYRFLTSRTSEGFNANLMTEIDQINPDLIVYGLLDVVNQPDLRRSIRERFPRATIVFWYGDLRNEATGQIEDDCADTIDAMFVSNDGQREFYQRKLKIENVYCLPLACEPIDAPRRVEDFGFDFVFIGAKVWGWPFEERARFVEALEQRQGLVQIDSFDPALREQVYRVMPEIYSSARISLDISHFWDVPKYCSIRYWEIPAFWGFALSRRFPGCEEFYQDRIHRVYFDSLEECIDLQNYYLHHEAERERIRRAGWEHSHRHTYKERFEEMFRILDLSVSRHLSENVPLPPPLVCQPENRGEPVKQDELKPVPLRDEDAERLYSKMGDAVFRATWLGIPALKNPCDAWVYQEIVAKTRPDWIIECGSGKGGGALFLATICDGLSHGNVLSIDAQACDRPSHPRITWITGKSSAMSAEVRRLVSGNVMVILDSDHSTENVDTELRLYSPLVSPGQYLIVEDTFWNSDQGGPWLAVRAFLLEHPEFEIDKGCERYLWTNNPNGFLRRR